MKQLEVIKVKINIRLKNHPTINVKDIQNHWYGE